MTGSEGFGTGGGGAGGTGVDPGSVSRTVDDPETLKALAGKTPCVVAVPRPGGGEMGLHLLERVQLAVIVLHRVHVVVRTPAQEDGRGQSHQDHDTGYPTDQHQLIFNRICRATEGRDLCRR